MKVLQRRDELAHLVDQDDCLPTRREIEHVVEGGVERSSVSAEVTTADDVQRAPDVLACGFRGERLAHSWRPKEIEDEPVAFSVDEVVETCVGTVRVDE